MANTSPVPAGVLCLHEDSHEHYTNVSLFCPNSGEEGESGFVGRGAETSHVQPATERRVLVCQHIAKQNLQNLQIVNTSLYEVEEERK